MKSVPDVRRATTSAFAAAILAACVLFPDLALAGSPFATGATGFQTTLLAILTPVAVIAVMVSGVMGWFGKISWWWLVGVIIGIVLVFGAQQIVAWIRGMAGV